MKTSKINILIHTLLVAFALTFVSCRDEDGLAYEFMPDMYRSPSIEPYVDYADYGNPDNLTARKPVEGTIARGYMPYSIPNTPEGYELAGQTLKSPIMPSEETIKEGKELFTMFCVHCHGKTGQGDGSLVEREKFPPVPTKFSPGLELPDGKMFHTITYGKGLMGAHASQLTQEERWLLVNYIQYDLVGKDKSVQVSDSSTNQDSVETLENPELIEIK